MPVTRTCIVWRSKRDSVQALQETFGEAPESSDLEQVMARATVEVRQALDRDIAELRDLPYSFWRDADGLTFQREGSGRGGQIRTGDPSVPNRVLYQAEPRPDMVSRGCARKLGESPP